MSIQYCVDIGKQTTNNIIRVELQPTVEINTKDIHRNFYMTSSCGICGKASIEAIQQRCEPSLLLDIPKVTLATINGLNEALKRHQQVFEYTGGLHAAALYSEKGDILLVREDVGRHNALDKLIGNALTQTILPLSNTILLMSSRASFELIQKAVMAGISVIATIGAPSSLAIDTANTFGVTLLGFVRNQQFNIYTGKQRIIIN
jgi:FdhD protein